jgi:transposase
LEGDAVSVQIEALFTSALGLQPPWAVRDVRLDTARHRIDFDVECKQALLACPACGAASQKVHDRLSRSWRHLDFFQFEAWLHADVPRVGCAACGKTTQIGVPWAREGSGFTLLFEALALMSAAACSSSRTVGLNIVSEAIADMSSRKRTVVLNGSPRGWSDRCRGFARDAGAAAYR